MTVIENNSPKVQYTGPYDIGQLLPLTFPYDQPEDVHMQIGSTEATYNTEYFISGLTPESVTLKEPIDSGVLITIYRETPLDQQSDFPQNARFSSKRIEDALDKLCMEQQEQEEKLSRCVISSVSSSGFNGTLPTPESGRALIWNENANGFINTDFDLSTTGWIHITNVSEHISAITNCDTHMDSIVTAPTYADSAQKWAEGADAAVQTLGGTHSAKRWAELYSHVYVGITPPTDPSVDVWLYPDGEVGNISALNNDVGYITGINSTDVVNALGYIPYSSSNPNNYTSNKGTVTSVNNIQPVNGNVTISIPTETTVSDWGFTKNIGTVTSVNSISPSNGDVSIPIPTDTSELTNSAGYVTSATLSGYQQKSTIVNLPSLSTYTIHLADNTIYKGGTFSNLTILPPASATVDFICQIIFSSDSLTATELTSNDIIYIGDDTLGNVFTPDIGKRYTVIFYYDGVNFIGVVKGIQ